MTLESYWLENRLYYDSRVVIYDIKMFYKIDHRSPVLRILQVNQLI